MPYRWQDDALCPSVPWERFFDDIWNDDEPVLNDRPPAPDLEALERARAICRRCPVRRSCLMDELAAEQGDGVTKRFGLRALMTPHQRWSLEKRGVYPRCPRCSQPADPVEYLAGEWTCCHMPHTVAPLPDEGDEWYKRHTKLAVTIVAWLREHVERGTGAPTPAVLSEELSVRTNDVRRIYRALVEDGTLADLGAAQRPRYVLKGRLGASWQPPHVHVSPVV